MTIEKKQISLEDWQLLYNRYFKITQKIYYWEPVHINDKELMSLLEDYCLGNQIKIFRQLANLAPYYIATWEKSEKIIEDLEAINNEQIDLIKLAWKMSTGQYSNIQIKTDKGDKVKLSYLAGILQLGDAIIVGFTNIKSEEEIDGLAKTSIKKGRPASRASIALLIDKLLAFLNNETSLKSGDAIITNQQGRFIKDFLEFANILKDDNSVLDEEYIRTIHSNYKDKDWFKKLLYTL